MDYQKNYYQILGVDKNSTDKEIKDSYRKLAKKFHPDKHNGDATAENQFKAANEANSILSDPQKRQDYDVKSPHGRNHNPFAQQMGGFSFTSGFGGFGSDIFDVFQQFGFGGGGFGQRQQQFIEHLDMAANINISLADVYNNKPITIKYNRQVPCAHCDFTGFDPASDTVQCDMCNGSGHDVYRRSCEYCRGKGKIHTGTCTVCNGNKIVIKEEEFQLNNIFKLRDNKSEFLQGYGHHSKHYRNKVGHLQVNLIFHGDHRYEIRENDLYHKLNLHYQDAIDGIDYIYEHLDGKPMKVKIPANTKDKDLIRVQNHGLMFNQVERGHLIFDINIIIDYERVNKTK